MNAHAYDCYDRGRDVAREDIANYGSRANATQLRSAFKSLGRAATDYAMFLRGYDDAWKDTERVSVTLKRSTWMFILDAISYDSDTDREDRGRRIAQIIREQIS